MDEPLEYLKDFDPQTPEEVPAGTAWCFYISASQVGPSGGLIPSVVYENVSGFFPLSGTNGAAPWEWGDYPTASRIAREQNAKREITPARALEIVSSSMRMSDRQGR